MNAKADREGFETSRKLIDSVEEEEEESKEEKSSEDSISDMGEDGKEGPPEPGNDDKSCERHTEESSD